MISISVQVEVNFDKFENVPKNILHQVGLYMVSSTQKKILKAKPPNSPLTIMNKRGSNVLRDSGQLFNSITYKVSSHRQIRIGTDRKYAYVHQFGGVIYPKFSQKLTIPFGWKMRRQVEKYGSVKRTIENLKNSGWKIWWTEKAVMGRKEKGKPSVLFIRKEKVTIPKRPFLYVSKHDQHAIQQIVWEGLNE